MLISWDARQNNQLGCSYSTQTFLDLWVLDQVYSHILIILFDNINQYLKVSISFTQNPSYCVFFRPHERYAIDNSSFLRWITNFRPSHVHRSTERMGLLHSGEESSFQTLSLDKLKSKLKGNDLGYWSWSWQPALKKLYRRLMPPSGDAFTARYSAGLTKVTSTPYWEA